MNVNKLVNTLGKALAGRPTNNNKSSNKRRTTRRRRNRNRRRGPGRITRAMPAAYASHIRPRFSILSRSNRHCVVSGCDLIYKIPATLTSNGDALFSVITANPAYWKGTRIGRIAPAYQTYRPISFKVSYIPQVAVTQPGTVFMGTMWDMAPPQDNLQQSLLTSNGGQLTQCYIPADSTVALGRNLQQNLFKMSGELSTDTNPFLFCVGVAGADVIPGYLYITYQYELRNPIGDAWTYINSGVTTVAALPEQQSAANGCIVLLNQVGALGPGTILDREYNSGLFFYHGSTVNVPDQTSVVYFNNFQTATATAVRSISDTDTPPIYLTGFTETSGLKHYFNEFLPKPEGENTDTDVFVIYQDINSAVYYIGYFYTSLTISVMPEPGYRLWTYKPLQGGDYFTLYTDESEYLAIPRESPDGGDVRQAYCIRLSTKVNIVDLPIFE